MQSITILIFFFLIKEYILFTTKKYTFRMNNNKLKI